MTAVSLALGVVFGALPFVSGMADYDVIHRGLLLQEGQLYRMMIAVVGIAPPLLVLLRRRG